mgnify:CR=1 FL=1
MEKIFHLRWWDYSQKKFNINGRVCLDTIIPFGILGMLIMYILNPFFLEKLNLLSQTALNIVFYIVIAIYVTDNIISLITMFGIRKTTASVSRENREDNTEEITKKVMGALTDPNRIRKDDLGNPDVCMVAYYHNLFSSKEEVKAVCEECKAGKRGCVACKKQLIANIIKTLEPIRKKRKYC